MPGYETVERLQAAKAVVIAEMPGWVSPAAYALGVAAQGGWRVTNHRNIPGFPAVALSKVLGHGNGSATYRTDPVIDEANAKLRAALGID